MSVDIEDDEEKFKERLLKSKLDYVPSPEEICALLDRYIFSSTKPIVISIVGKWGEGKTYFWKNTVLKKFATTPSIYASVFGANSIQEIRDRVVFEAVRNPDWLKKYGGQKSKNITENVPGLKFMINKTQGFWSKWPEVLNAVLFPKGFTTRFIESDVLNNEFIICLDDIERISTDIGIENLLGYVNELRDEHNCRVVLIYNEDKIDKEVDIFHRLQEKVIDKKINFSPNIENVFKIVFKENNDLRISSDIFKELSRQSVVLSIRNIRLFNKVSRYYSECIDILRTDPDDSFKQNLLSSLLLYVWIKYCPEDSGKLTLEYISRISSFLYGYNSNKNEDDPMKEAKELLEKFKYSYTSELDLILLQLVEHDILNDDLLREEFKKHTNQFSAVSMKEAFSGVWQKYYHGTLRDTENEFCKELIKITEQYIKLIPIGNFDEVLRALNDFNRGDDADNLMELFEKERQDTLCNFNRGELFEPVKNEKLGKLLADSEKHNNKDERSIGEVIMSATSTDLPSYNDRKKLSEFTEDDYFKYFTTNDVDHMTSIMRELAGYAVKFQGGDDYEKKLRTIILNVAERISNMSSISRRRMQSMGLISNGNDE